MKHLVSLLMVAALIVSSQSNAWAQAEITLLSPNPIETAIDTLVANFEAKTGNKVKVTYGTGVSTRKTVASGQALDVTLLFAPFPEALATGNIVKESATVVATQRLAIGVKKGAPKPDISNAAAVKRMLLNAKSISAIDPEQGSAGGATLAALEKMGITEQVRPKIAWLRNAGMVQDAVAKGESEIALGPYYSEMRNPGLDVVGALPPDAAPPVEVTGFLSTSAKDSKAAKALLDYLGSREAAPVYEAAKIFPVQTVSLLSPNPIETTINKLVADFEARTGNKVKVTYGTGVSTRKTVADGQASDVSLLFAPFPEALKTGNIVKESATVIARLRVALAVKKGAPTPDISNAAAVKRTLLNAKSISAVDPEQGSAGGAALLALDKMGITQQVRPKITWVRTGGNVQDAVAKGEAEIALGPYISDMRNPGLDIVGALPPDAAPPIDITGFLSTSARNSKEAKALLDFLASRDAAPAYEAAKLFPVR